jgi:hypothetical protein
MLFTRQPEEPRKSPGAIVLSVALHVFIGALVLRAVVGPNGLVSWVAARQARNEVREEKVTYVVPRTQQQVASGGSARDPRTPPRAGQSAPFAAPTSVPTALPEASGRGGSGGGTGTGVGIGSGSGAVRGIVPDYDERLYPGPAEKVAVERTQKEQLDSVITERFARFRDSAAAAPRSNVTEDGSGDLTFKRGGRTYGWSQKGIVLGNVTLPAPLLALLPFNQIGGNPSSLLRGENTWAMRRDIQASAQNAMTVETFNERVKRIRERRDKERAEQREQQRRQREQQQVAPAALPASNSPARQ